MRKSFFDLAGLLFLSAVLAACATTARFEKMMDDHLGMPIAELQRQFGYNYIERQLADGSHVYTWIWKEQGVSPAYQTPTTIESFSSDRNRHVIVIPGTYFPPTPYETSCEFSFVVDKTGKTVSWRAHGNGCAVFEGPGKVLRSGGKS